MGLLKKKGDEAEPEAAADPEEAPVAEAPAGDVLGEASVAPDLAGAVTDAVDEPPEAAADAEPAADGTDALLSMFATSDTGPDDRALLVEIAGEVEVADLVDQARTLAAALNIAIAQD
jgi:hypothetical protein